MTTIRVTVKDVRVIFARACEAAMRAGIDSRKWHLSQGSKAYGKAWGIHNGPTSINHLGDTARDAQAALLAYALAWEATPYVPENDLNRE